MNSHDPDIDHSNLATSTEVPVEHTPAEPPIKPVDPAIEAEIAQFGVLYPFPLDTFQKEAIRTFLEGDSVMVAS
ncbi:MAG: hypothetical protein WKF81_14885, partial [Thermomicrobiales bacterium]